MAKATGTREKILEVAQNSVLAKGFAATSIDEIIAETGITKSGFFYHFRDKNELAREMLRRFANENAALFETLFERGRQLSDDPLEAFLIGLKLLAETLRDLKSKHPGCLIAAICYQERLFDRDVVAMNRQVTVDWNAGFRARLEEIAAVYPVRGGIDVADMADALTATIDGGILMARILDDPERLERQILTYRSFVRLAFAAEAPRMQREYFAIAAE